MGSGATTVSIGGDCGELGQGDGTMERAKAMTFCMHGTIEC